MPQRGGRVKGVYLSLKGRLKKGFQTAFVCHAYDYALLGKANRTYAGMNVENETRPSEKRFQTAFVYHAYDYALLGQS